MRCQVPAGDPVVPSLFDLWPGSEAHERETFDMFGIRFSDHPDLTRILMPEDWEGHPLRKDYAAGACPGAVQGGTQVSAGRTAALRRPEDSADRPAEGQDLRRHPGNDRPREVHRTGARIRDSVGCCACPRECRLDANDINYEAPDDETMILNLGPSHPSTHGVLRVMVEIRGEQVLRTKPVIGYLHTGMEKTGEELMYHQGATNVTRMDYLSPFFNELAFCLSVEKLAGIEIPERAGWIRMLMCELNRISSHLLWLATNGADLGALNMLVYGWRDRELLLAFLKK